MNNKQRKKQKRILVVTWRDSSIYSQQQEIQDFTVSVFESVGFELENNKDRITITRELIRNEVRGTIAIPRENIIKVRVLNNK